MSSHLGELKNASSALVCLSNTTLLLVFLSAHETKKSFITRLFSKQYWCHLFYTMPYILELESMIPAAPFQRRPFYDSVIFGSHKLTAPNHRETLGQNTGHPLYFLYLHLFWVSPSFPFSYYVSDKKMSRLEASAKPRKQRAVLDDPAPAQNQEARGIGQNREGDLHAVLIIQTLSKVKSEVKSGLQNHHPTSFASSGEGKNI